MKASLIRKFLGLSVGGALIISAIAGAFVTGLVAYASSPQGTPDAQVRVGDAAGDSHPNLPSQCSQDSSPQWVGTNEGVSQSTSGGSNDMDCIKVRIQNGNLSTQYTRDFKICLGIPYNTVCTPWASQGGGFAGPISNGVGNIHGAQVWVVDQDMPVQGMKIDNVQVGVQFYYQKDNNACRGSSGMAWSSGGESNWAYGEQHDNDPGCASVGLIVRQVLPPNAQYVADTVPRQADPSTTYAASITMKNKGITWDSDHIVVPEHNNCANSVPNNGDTCDDSFVVESTHYLLVRQDQTSVQAPSTLPYRRTINVHYERVIGQECEFEPGSGGGCDGSGGGYGPINKAGGRSFVRRTVDALAPVAYALPCGPGGGGGTLVCTDYDYVSQSQTPTRDVYLDRTADFPISVRTPGESGVYELLYQMVDTRDASHPFGDVVHLPITVGDNNASIGLACTTLSQTVDPGDPTSYGVSVSGTGGFAGQVTVNVSPTSTLPAGVTSTAATLTLPPSPQNGLVLLSTSQSTPAGAYPITLRATAQGVASRDCQTELIVNDHGTATLTVTPDTQDVSVNGTAHYEATYDPDGPGVGQDGYPVTIPASWTSDVPGVATATGAGTFQGTATGTTMIWAAYGGLQASARLNVGNTGSNGTLEIVPDTVSTYVGSEVTVRAIYHAIIGDAGTDVTAGSYWASGNRSIASVQGDGRYRGEGVGSTTMDALYPVPNTSPVEYLSASGRITVGSASGATLTVSPPSQEIQVGSTANYTASYDPDGIRGPAPTQDVTAFANWSGPSFLTLTSPGAFRGDRIGSGSVQASYAGKDATAGITVTNGGQCTFGATPSTLFVPPPRSTTLNWNCQQPTSCTIRVQDTPRAGQTVATGGQSGSGHDTPPYSTTYRLNCDNGVQQDVRVRVFDVSTRIEILPH